ncbi:MAG TPA: NAD(P)-dependent oxidoreductase [Candidatus Pristimantibacillus sp.]|nr:NAD(P)-dependent oxidoreductase [Candidatus Pristimantibacillus sp.]
MSNTSVFIFDEIFEAMAGADQLAALQAMDAELHIVNQKCRIADYAPTQNPETQKIFCINPDFVDWNYTGDDYKDIPGLKVIVSSSDNISWLDTEYAQSHGIEYLALEDLKIEYSAVAEYAVTIMMNLARRVPMLIRDNFPLDFAHDFLKYQGTDLAGKTAGIIGLGNIGGAIAARCAGLGMKVVYWSRHPKSESGYAFREIDALLKEADVIFPTLKPNDETKHLLPNNRLEIIRPDAMVVSVVSELVDNGYLAGRVAEKKLFGFGFGADPGVFGDYSGNVWAVPDYAWATKGNMRTTYDQFVDKIIASVG